MNKPYDSLLLLHHGAYLRICCFRESLTELAVRLIDSDRSHYAAALQRLLSLSGLEKFQGQFQRVGHILTGEPFEPFVDWIFSQTL